MSANLTVAKSNFMRDSSRGSRPDSRVVTSSELGLRRVERDRRKHHDSLDAARFYQPVVVAEAALSAHSSSDANRTPRRSCTFGERSSFFLEALDALRDIRWRGGIQQRTS
jgi:hypothetical protein